MPNRSKGRGQTKSDPLWSSSLGIGLKVDNSLQFSKGMVSQKPEAELIHDYIMEIRWPHRIEEII